MDFSGILLIALIVIGIYLKWDDMKNWETVYEGTGSSMHKAQARFAYLKARGVRCRLKTLSPKLSSRGGPINPTMATTMRVDVYKKDLDKARNLLNDFNGD